MPNITTTEWKERAAKIAAELVTRWPWLAVGAGICVACPMLQVSTTLDWTRRGDTFSAEVRIRIDRSSAIDGGMLGIAEAARQIAEVRNAMLFVHGVTHDLTIWQDGECPCGFCSSRGTTHGKPCDRCAGKGRR